MIHPLHFFTLLIGIADIVLAFLIFARNKDRKENKSFALFVFFIALWVICSFFLDSQIFGPEPVMFFARLVLVPAIFLSYLFLTTVKNFTGEKITKMQNWLLMLPVLPLLLFSPTSANIQSFTTTVLQVKIHAGWLYAPFSIYFIIYFFVGLKKLFLFKKKEKGYRSWQASIIFWSILVAAGVGITYDGILAIFNARFLPINIGPMISIIVSVSIGYAMIRYRFMGMRLRLGRKEFTRRITWSDLPNRYSLENLLFDIDNFLKSAGIENLQLLLKEKQGSGKCKFFDVRNKKEFFVSTSMMSLLENDADSVYTELMPGSAFGGAFAGVEKIGAEFSLLAIKFQKEILGFLVIGISNLNLEQREKVMKLNKELYFVLKHLSNLKQAL